MIQKQQNEVLGHPLPVSTYLLKPFQRILKYPELLKVNYFFCPTSSDVPARGRPNRVSAWEFLAISSEK